MHMATNILIAFYSRNGSAEALAKAIAEGAQAEGAEVRLRRARELVEAEIVDRVPGWRESMERQNALYHPPTVEDVEWADALILGAPTRFGIIASELKAFIDGLGGLWFQGKLFNKVGAAFSATASPHGGAEMTIIGLYAVLSQMGLIIVPNGYGDIHLAPDAGLIVLFPCWMEHYVEPHDSDETRIVIAFNALAG